VPVNRVGDRDRVPLLAMQVVRLYLYARAAEKMWKDALRND
jgi:hypothetical protein